MKFKDWAAGNKRSLHDLFPQLNFDEVLAIDMSIHSEFFGTDPQHEDLKAAAIRIEQFQQRHPKALLANGYLEQRSFYNTAAFQRKTNGRTEFRNIHLGTDFWIPAGTAIHSCFEGEIVISNDNNYHKDYGPTLVLKHSFETMTFYTLYGHLSRSTLTSSQKGKKVKQGECIGYIGDQTENGHWVPHLHFQLITDLLGETENFKGVAFPSEIQTWKRLCPDPDCIFLEQLVAATR
jgi:murein DD-endopeptidase MepM/ murein hydrolase activator NlpD